MIERLTLDVLDDKYFNSLYLKAGKLFANKLFLVSTDESLSEKEVTDLLRFADILSNSKNPDARNKAYQVITLLNKDHSENAFYRTFAHSVLAKLGNFPGIAYLQDTDDVISELPFEREIEKNIKQFIQAVPDTDDLVFTDSQFELYTQITNSKHFSFSGPTSMGKSFIIKSFIRKVVSNKPPENIVIMVPTRALINQFSIDLNKELKVLLEHNNYSVVTNSNVSEVPVESQQRFIFVLTPERLLSYLSQSGNPTFSYLFVDEAHKLAAATDMRAVTAYSAVSKALKQNPNLNLYFASPNVSNPEVFLKLFKKDENLSYKTKETPVSQNLFFVDIPAKKAIHYIGNSHHYEFTPDLVTQAVDVYEVIAAIGNGTNNIVYCSSKYEAIEKAENTFKYFSNVQSQPSNNIKKVIRQIKGYIHKDYYLAEFLSKGIAYHFGNLPQIIRNKIEALFKEREINYVFCTSTLLEGVNMPAKNVFILNNKNGKTPFEPIDFWNLAGRAGRLRYELSGNIICIKANDKVWQKSEQLLDRKHEIKLSPSVENYVDTQLKRIEQIITETGDIKGVTVTVKEILKYIANIISIDTLEIERSNYKSEIINKLIQENKEEIIALAKQKNGNIDVPSAVLDTNNSINLKIQNDAFVLLQKHTDNPNLLKLPAKVDYEGCKLWLRRIYGLFKLQTEEKEFKSEAQLDYYAMLMNQWINGISLNQIISQSITYYSDKRKTLHVGYVDGRPNYEVFNGSKQHINALIGNIIENIEYVLRFVLEKYFNNYYAMLVALLGEENAGVNWGTFLEYGSQNSIVIALQNYGLSRHSADYLFKNYRSCLKVEGDRLVEIDTKRLMVLLDKEAIEYDEISSLLF